MSLHEKKKEPVIKRKSASPSRGKHDKAPDVKKGYIDELIEMDEQTENRETDTALPDEDIVETTEIPAERKKNKKTKKSAKAAAEKEPKLPKAKKKGGRKALVVLICIAVVIVLLCGGAIYGGYRVSTGTTNLPNVYVDDIHVGGLTGEQTIALLEEKQWQESANKTLNVKLPNDISFDVDYINAGACLTSAQVVEKAYLYGHSGNYIENGITFIKNVMKPVDVTDAAFTINTDYLRENAQKAVEEFEKSTGEKGYTIDEKNSTIIYIKGAGELTIDTDKLVNAMAETIKNGGTDLEWTEIAGNAETPDFAKLNKLMAVEAKDAYYDTVTGKVVPEIIGVSFDVDKAVKLWEKAELLSKVEIPVKMSIPEVRAEELEKLIFRDMLGQTVTTFWGSSDNRINNIGIVAEKLNGLIMMPGDEFSYNETIGERTEEAGFKAAPAYDDGQVVYQLGGGICQGSSTLYCTVLNADLEVLFRRCHDFDPGYLPKGLDATVSWGSPDFKFKNNTEYPIKIAALCDKEEHSLTIEIWGTNLDGSYVEAKSGWYAMYDEEYPEVQTGWGAVTYKYHYDKDGNLLEKEFVDNSSYMLHEEDIKWPAEKTAKEEGGTGETEGGDSGGESSGDSGDVVVG